MGAMGVDEIGGVVIIRINPEIGFIKVCFFKMIKGTGNHAIIAARALLWVVCQHFLVQEFIRH
jgi:hypothetical protein